MLSGGIDLNLGNYNNNVNIDSTSTNAVVGGAQTEEAAGTSASSNNETEFSSEANMQVAKFNGKSISNNIAKLNNA